MTVPFNLSRSSQYNRPSCGEPLCRDHSKYGAAIQLLRRYCLLILVCMLCAVGAQNAWAQPATAPVVTAIPGNTQVTLKWDAVPTATVYDVYLSIDGSDGSIVTSPPNNVNGISISRTSLTNGTTYYFKVRARNSAGSGPLSDQVIATPVNPPVINERLLDHNSVTLKWSEVITPNLSHYEVLRKLDGTSDPFALVDTTTALTYTDTGVTDDIKYAYRIRVANPTSNTNLMSGTIFAQPTGTPVIRAIAGSREVTIKFDPIPSATQYQLFISTDPTQIGTYSAANSAPEFNCTVYSGQALANGTKYYFRMRPYTGWGTPAYSNQVACTPISGPVLEAPVLGDNSVSLTWSAVVLNPEAPPGTAISYEVYRAHVGDDFTTALTTTSATTYIDTTALNNTAYKYRIQAANPETNPYLRSSTLNATPMKGVVLNTAVPGVGQVALSWEPVDGATSYRVYQSENPTLFGPSVANPTTNSVNRTGLVNGRTYYFRVQARNATGSGIVSNQESAMPLALPVAVNPVTLTPGDGQITLSFSAIEHASSYRIYRSTTSNTYDYVNPTLIATGTGIVTATDTDLTNRTTYYYVVRTVNTSGVSASSTQVSATPLQAPPATAPTLSITAGTSSASLNWTAVASASHYRVKRATTAGGPYTTLNNQITVTDLADAPLTNGATYYYRVYAVNGGGNGPDSDEVSTTPLPLPASVSTVTLTPGDSQIGISFAAVADASEYQIYRATTSNGYDYTTATLTATGTGTVTALDTNLMNGTQYYYVVRAVNSVGTSALSAPVNAIPKAVPVAPSLYATAGDSVVSLYWNNVTTATSYTLKRGTSAGGPYTTIAPTLIATDFEDTTVVNGTTYYYVVVANNASGAGPVSNEKSAKPVPPLPEAPENLRFERGNLQTTILWDAVDGATGYKIASSATEEGLATASFSTVATTSYLHTGLTSGTTYYYRVKAYNAGGESESVDIEVTAYTYGFIITPLTGLSTDRAGGTDTFTVQLAVLPTASVTLALSSDNTAEGTIDKSTLTFTTTDWNTPQTVTITGQNPGSGTRDKIYRIVTGTVSSTDSNYQMAATSVPDVTVINYVTATPPVENPPIPLPSASVLSLVGTPTEEAIELSWTENADVGFDHYELHRSLSEGFTPSEATLVEQFDLQSDITAPDSQLEWGTTYYYKLVTQNQLGQGATSNEVEASTASITPPTDPPSVVTLSWDTCQPTTIGQVGLVWTANTASEFLKYEVHRSTTENFTPSAATLRGEVLSESECKYIDDEVDAETDYFYKVVVINRAKQTAASNEISITHNPPVV